MCGPRKEKWGVKSSLGLISQQLTEVAFTGSCYVLISCIQFTADLYPLTFLFGCGKLYWKLVHLLSRLMYVFMCKTWLVSEAAARKSLESCFWGLESSRSQNDTCWMYRQVSLKKFTLHTGSPHPNMQCELAFSGWTLRLSGMWRSLWQLWWKPHSPVSVGRATLLVRGTELKYCRNELGIS